MELMQISSSGLDSSYHGVISVTMALPSYSSYHGVTDVTIDLRYHGVTCVTMATEMAVGLPIIVSVSPVEQGQSDRRFGRRSFPCWADHNCKPDTPAAQTCPFWG